MRTCARSVCVLSLISVHTYTCTHSTSCYAARNNWLTHRVNSEQSNNHQNCMWAGLRHAYRICVPLNWVHVKRREAFCGGLLWIGGSIRSFASKFNLQASEWTNLRTLQTCLRKRRLVVTFEFSACKFGNPTGAHEFDGSSCKFANFYRIETAPPPSCTIIFYLATVYTLCVLLLYITQQHVALLLVCACVW